MPKPIKAKSVIILFRCPTKRRDTEVHLYPDEIECSGHNKVVVTCPECGKNHHVEVALG